MFINIPRISGLVKSLARQVYMGKVTIVKLSINTPIIKQEKRLIDLHYEDDDDDDDVCWKEVLDVFKHVWPVVLKGCSAVWGYVVGLNSVDNFRDLGLINHDPVGFVRTRVFPLSCRICLHKSFVSDIK